MSQKHTSEHKRWGPFEYTRVGSCAALYLFNRAIWFWVGDKSRIGNLQRGK